jgi:hypothetical protein
MYYKLNLILTYFIPAISFVLITVLLLFQIFKKRLPSLKTLGNLIKIFISFLIIFAFFLSAINYFAWKNNNVSQRLLPPYASITYVLHYSWQHYFFASIVTIIFALIVFWGIKSLNKKFNNTFFYDEEPYLAALGILATGWPNCLIYLCLVLLLGVIAHFIIQKGRLPLLYFWLPCALLVLLLSGIISKYITINQLVI